MNIMAANMVPVPKNDRISSPKPFRKIRIWQNAGWYGTKVSPHSKGNRQIKFISFSGGLPGGSTYSLVQFYNRAVCSLDIIVSSMWRVIYQ